jgi:ribosomal protein S13
VPTLRAIGDIIMPYGKKKPKRKLPKRGQRTATNRRRRAKK